MVTRANENDAPTLSDSEIGRVIDAAREYDRDLSSLLSCLSVNLDADDARVVELFVTTTIFDRRGWDTIHADEVARMTRLFHDVRDLFLLIVRAIDGDFEAQVAVQRAAGAARASGKRRLTNIERRRVQLQETLEQLRSSLEACPVGEVNNVLEYYLREVRKCDPRLNCSDDVLTDAMRKACEATTSDDRRAAKFTYSVDMFGERRKFRCANCFETNHPCAKCPREGVAVTAIEACFGKARRKHGVDIVDTAQRGTEK
jgi:hypothetical protein